MFERSEEEYLINAMKDNNVVIFLGAGASYGSETSSGEKIPLGKGLGDFLRSLIGETEENLRLDQIGKDVRRVLGEAGLKRKLEEKFLETRPSKDLIELFSFKWNRCYTLNYDDTIEGIPRHKKKQRHRYYVGTDKVEEGRGQEELQVIHLNGSIRNFEKGIVLTDKEFRSAIRTHTPWYERCASDYASKTFIFVGTALDEPIFKAYVEGIEHVSTFAKSFLITPSGVTDRDAEDLRELNIFSKKNTLSDLVAWLKRNEGKLSESQHKLSELLIEIGSPEWVSESIDNSTTGSAKNRRNFYSGMYPTWQCVASRWPADLSIMRDSSAAISKFVAENAFGLCLVVGPAGSGKTTCLMNALFRLSSEKDRRVFEFKGDSADRLEATLSSLRPIEWGTVKCIIWMPDFQIYADEIERISKLADSYGAVIIAELRSSDWSGRFFGKHKEAKSVVPITTLKDEDYRILADAIQEFAIAPEFRRMTRSAQVSQLRRSRNQLLILMLEATKQRPFEEIIENEYASIDNEEAKAFLCIVAVITLTRARISVSEYNTIISLFGLRSSLSVCLAQLEGVVELTDRGMLVGRHESYVNHILSSAADVETIYEACLAIFRSFTIYEVPFVINAGRVKGNILKFMMRGTFLLQVFRNNRDLVAKLYDELEFDFQNDGHYWLQRGKFYRSNSKRQHQETALRYFERSVEAYDNPYARHSLAQQKIIYCSYFSNSSPHLEALLAEGVSELKTQAITRADAEDEYPLVALANSHPKALLAWGRKAEAKSVCQGYHKLLTDLDRQMPRKDPDIQEAIKSCLSIIVS